MIKKLILSAAAALLCVEPAAASDLWGAVRNNFGNVSIARYDTATGNMISGSNVFMDTAFSGQSPNLVDFNELGALAFDGAGNLWGATNNGFGVSIARYDTATGNMISGSNIFMDTAFSGQSPNLVDFSELGAMVFAPDSTAIGSVPEPSTWAMMIAGFFLTGAASRRRRSRPQETAA